MVVVDIEPGTGREAGGTVVRVIGSHFPSGTDLGCMFGKVGSGSGHWSSSSVVECVSPGHVAGNVSVGISGNGVDFAVSPRKFLYTAAVILMS
eukprot:599167-Rhodomonas_salina.1